MYIIALDQGTTSSRAIVFNQRGEICSMAQREFTQIYPKPGWVEHDPREIWSSQEEVLHAAVSKGGISPDEIQAIGITNQRETTILWNKKTGEPVHNAIVWQCRRTAAISKELRDAGYSGVVADKTGLLLDPYFSGTKVKWLLENVPQAKKLADSGDLAFGTVDTWLLWNLTRGEVHATDVTNAARTMMFNIHTLAWDDELLTMLGVPRGILPKVVPSSGVIGHTKILGGRSIPVAGIAGDQHAALFGQACFTPGMVKNTYGTGCFLLANSGGKAVASANRLLSTPGWTLSEGKAEVQPGKTSYAIEGSIFIGGAAVQWLRDSLKLVANAPESELFATQEKDSGGVYVVPAFVGLGAPHWDSYARGGMFGLTAGSNRNHIIRATLESIAYQSRDVVEAMLKDGLEGEGLVAIRVDGGASNNNFLMQFQADILGIPVERPKVSETTALGAAYLAGLGTGMWNSLEQIDGIWQIDRRFEPSMNEDQRESLYSGWQEAVRRVMGWESP